MRATTARAIHGLLHLGLFGLGRLSRGPIAPRVFRQWCGTREMGFEGRINGDARRAQLHQVMRFPKGPIVPGEEGLQPLFHRLLAVKGRIAPQRR